MMNEEILKKAIEKAKSVNGELGNMMLSYDPEAYGLYDIIFSHDFAKAFWGDKKIGHDFTKHRDILLWMSSLQEMVLEEDPIKYLEKFL